MRKKLEYHGITIKWDTANISDMFNTKNAVYCLQFKNGSSYIGSCSNLAQRILNHCTSAASKDKRQRRLVTKAIRKFGNFKVVLLKQYGTIEEARYYEKKLIKKCSSEIADRLGCFDGEDFATTVNSTLLNEQLYKWASS